MGVQKAAKKFEKVMSRVKLHSFGKSEVYEAGDKAYIVADRVESFLRILNLLESEGFELIQMVTDSRGLMQKIK